MFSRDEIRHCEQQVITEVAIYYPSCINILPVTDLLSIKDLSRRLKPGKDRRYAQHTLSHCRIVIMRQCGIHPTPVISSKDKQCATLPHCRIVLLPHSAIQQFSH